MYCPECGYEYRQGILKCPDCEVELTTMPPDPDRDVPRFAEFVEILDTFNPFDIAIIKSMLDSEGIRYHFIGESFAGIYPMATAPRLMVLKEHEEMAREILSDIKLTYLASHSPEDEYDDEPDDEEEPT